MRSKMPCLLNSNSKRWDSILSQAHNHKSSLVLNYHFVAELKLKLVLVLKYALKIRALAYL